MAKSGRASSTHPQQGASPARDSELEYVARWNEKASKKRLEKAQATYDTEFYKEQLDRYYQMLWSTEAKLEVVQRRVELDDEMNKYGGVVAEKVVEAHRTDRDKLLKKVATLHNQIHSAEKRLRKSEEVINNA